MTINVEGGRYLAEHIPGARYIELPGKDHPPWIGDNAMEIADAIEEFLTGTRPAATVDRVLATVLFTDIVGSTEKAATLGDQRWRDLLEIHHSTIRRNLGRFRGHEIKTTGDGILATFDGPARGVRCACAIADEIKPLGLDVRAGLLVEVKTPAESSGRWDYYKIIATIPGDQAFRPAGEDGCPLIKR